MVPAGDRSQESGQARALTAPIYSPLGSSDHGSQGKDLDVHSGAGGDVIWGAIDW